MSRSPTGHGFWMPASMGGDGCPGTGGDSPQASAWASSLRLARNFRGKFVTRRLVAICFVLRGWNWSSATLAVLNQHLAITRQGIVMSTVFTAHYLPYR
jgi:hypothetical protein